MLLKRVAKNGLVVFFSCNMALEPLIPLPVLEQKGILEKFSLFTIIILLPPYSILREKNLLNPLLKHKIKGILSYKKVRRPT